MSNVGIVFVSHSEQIALGLKELTTQAIQNVSIEAAGGTDDGEIGTNLEKILSAIDSVYSDKGVLILFDLGSALMNAEMAMELSGRENILIADAPLIEGGYVAAVESSMGRSLQEVLEAAEQVREQPKRG